MGEGGQKVHTSSCKINKFWNVMYYMVTIAKKLLLYFWKLLREQTLKNSHHKLKNKKCNHVWWTRHIVVITSQYIQTQNHYVLHLKVI